MTTKLVEEHGLVPRLKYDPARGNPGDVEIPNRIFVKGFPKDASEDDIKEFFESFGIVRHTKIVCDKTGTSKGYAFVTFDSQEVAEKVKDMGTLQNKEREIIIGPAKIRKKRPILGSFRPRPDQMAFWPTQVAPQPLYYAISPDGTWYYHVHPTIQVPQYSAVPIASTPPAQTTAPVQYQQYEYQPITQQVQQVPVWPFTPQQAPVTILQSGQPTQVLSTPTGHTIQQATTSNIAGATHSPAFPISVSGLTERMSAVSLNEYIKLSSRKNSPTEGIEYQQLQATPPGHSPPQCVPVYDNALLHEDAILQDGLEHSNVVYLDAGKLKTVVVKRDLPKHVHGTYLPAAGVQAIM